MMKPYVSHTNSGRKKARDDIYHNTADGGRSNRTAAAKAQRKAARQEGRGLGRDFCDG